MGVPLIFILIVHFAAGQRSVIFTSLSGTGTRHVRYETTANNFFDANGNVVPDKSIPEKMPDGTTVYSCFDIMGRVRKNGEEYERPNGRFRYRCNNGIEEIIACFGSERTGKALIKIDSTFYKDGFWHKCAYFSNNHTAVYTEEAACFVNNKTYHVGEKIRSAFFLMSCEESGYKIIGCYYHGKNNEPVDMKPGTVAQFEGVTHHCDDDDGNIKYYAKGAGCTKNGKFYREGEAFRQNHLNYKCTDGLVEITGCYIREDGPDFEVGQDVVENNMVYRCYSSGGSVHYEEYACGFRGTPPCSPPPIPKVPNVPNLKSPGFRSFSIVQQVRRDGNKVAAGSDTVRLELPKNLPTSFAERVQ